MRTFRIVSTTAPKVADAAGPEVTELVTACIGDPAKRPTPADVADAVDALASR